MCGTIARLHPRAGRLGELIAFSRRREGVSVPGLRSSYLFRPDKDPDDRPTAFRVALLDGEARAWPTPTAPGQHARYLDLRALLEDDADWRDGTFEYARA
jgi:hypothetical protein